MTTACPLCSFDKRRHPELTESVLSFPVFAAGRHGRQYDEAHPAEAKTAPRTRWRVVEGCCHAVELNRLEWLSEAAIAGAWEEMVAQLKAAHQISQPSASAHS